LRIIYIFTDFQNRISVLTIRAVWNTGTWLCKSKALCAGSAYWWWGTQLALPWARLTDIAGWLCIETCRTDSCACWERRKQEIAANTGCAALCRGSKTCWTRAVAVDTSTCQLVAVGTCRTHCQTLLLIVISALHTTSTDSCGL
jgi:hypothetical protein